MPNTEKRSVFMDYIKNIGNKVGGFFDKPINAYNEQNSPENREKEIQRLQESNPNMDVEGFKKATEQTSEGKAIMDFGKYILRAGPRAVGQVWNTIIGENNFTPSTPTQRLIYGTEPVDNTFNRIKANQEFAKGFGYDPISSGAFGIVAGLAGTAFDILPGASGVRKGVLEKTVGKIATSTSEKVVQKEAGTLFRNYGVKLAEEDLAAMAPDLVRLTDPKDVESYLNAFIKTGIEDGRIRRPIPADMFNSQIGAEVFSELDQAKAGSRTVIEKNGQGMTGEVIGESSTFPQWVPKDLRETRYFEPVKEALMDGKLPKGKAANDLYDIVKAEIESRAGIVKKTPEYSADELDKIADYVDASIAGTRAIDPAEDAAIRELAMHKGIDPTLPTEELVQKFKPALDESYGMDIKANMSPDAIAHYKTLTEEVKSISKMIDEGNLVGKDLEQGKARIQEISGQLELLGKETAMSSAPGEAMQTLLGDTNKVIGDTNKATKIADNLNNVSNATEDLVIKTTPIVTPQQIVDLPSEQRSLIDYLDTRETPENISDAVKIDIANNPKGAISRGVMEQVRDFLYARGKIVDVDFAFDDALTSMKQLNKEYTQIGKEVPDDILRAQEEKMAERILSTARGYGDKIIARMQKAGIRDDVIQNAIVNEKVKLGDIVKFKKESNGNISAIITKSGVEFIEKNVKVAKNSEWLKRNTLDAIKKGAKSVGEMFEAPQMFFKRIGLKNVYDQLRTGERKYAEARKYYSTIMDNAAKGLSKADLEQITVFMHSKQGFAESIEKAGVKVPAFSELSDAQKKFISTWTKIKKQLEPQVLDLARQHGEDITAIDNYFPAYVKKDALEPTNWSIDNMMTRKDPFFSSLKERKMDVPFDMYEMNAANLAHYYINGATKYTELGSRSLPVKYLIESDEFVKAVGEDISKATHDWYKEVINPDPKATGFAKAISMLRKGAYRASLGLNPKTMAKQLITYLDYGIAEGGFFQKTHDIAKTIQQNGGFGSVIERVPDIGMSDMSSNIDKFLFGGIAATDKMAANFVAVKKLSKELFDAEKAGVKIDQKLIEESLTKIQDEVDLLMGGATAAQRPKAYRDELGKLALMFSSTMNSRFQWYLDKYHTALTTKNKKLLASLTAAMITTAYVESSINNMSMNLDDPAKAAAETAKSLGGNIPMAGAIIFGAESGNYDMFTADNSLSNIFKYAKQGKYGSAGMSAAEAAGLPRQLRRTYEGATVDDPNFGTVVGGKGIATEQELAGKKSSSGIKKSPSSKTSGSKSNTVKKSPKK